MQIFEAVMENKPFIMNVYHSVSREQIENYLFQLTYGLLKDVVEEKAAGKEIPYQIKPRRPGDIATCYADTKKAKEELGFVAERGIEEMCEDSWRWQSQNPNGYPD